MVDSRPHILLLEPYYGGSHRAFLTGLQEHVNCRFTLLSLPARKWKMRMQLAAPWFADRIRELVARGVRFDGILCSTFIDVAVLRSLLDNLGISLPLAIYFHENQFSYPGQVPDPGMFQFTSINFTSALCADRLAFNSRYNLQTFLSGIRGFLKKATDMELAHLEERIAAKSIILHPGIDFSPIDKTPRPPRGRSPVLVWNHRWEHDKDPETFFTTLFRLRDLDFELIVLGQRFRRMPEIFSRAERELVSRILYFGYAPDRQEYARLLRRGDIVVSTARHEFFGMAVLEGVRAGCRPLVPDRLAYRELFAPAHRYPENGLAKALRGLLTGFSPLAAEEAYSLTRDYSWPMLTPAYLDWLTLLCAGGRDRGKME